MSPIRRNSSKQMDSKRKALGQELNQLQEAIRAAQEFQVERMRLLNSRRESIVATWINSGSNQVSRDTAIKQHLSKIGVTIKEIGKWNSVYGDAGGRLLELASQLAAQSEEERSDTLTTMLSQSRDVVTTLIPQFEQLNDILERQVDELAALTS